MPKPGDLIEIDRGVYKHWALYMGAGYVIHIVPPSEVAGAGVHSLMSVAHNAARVQLDPLETVAGTDSYCVNNLLDSEYVPRDIDEILMEAKSMVGCVLRYDIISYNCEHFVTNLRYGKPESRQVRNALYGLAAVGGLALGAIAAAFILGNGRKEKKTKEHRPSYY
ncbi:phospholipase A and acyltransferase 3-like [Megalops cyprinoides]|uniref:phospholipase A and acyltransferase 3-like n=1 Tax=Megalops cyprinoides TaxID=118141 RepID=UPI00186532F7|nr:phospholipase A and acyltransferase 3-like [Megalops cyprinoides]